MKTPLQNDFHPFLVTLQIGTPYIPPKVSPTLDALLWGAIRLKYPDCENVMERIPLQQSDGIFHASRILMDPLFPELPSKQDVHFYQSIHTERDKDAIDPAWLNKKTCQGDPKNISPLKAGDCARGIFKVKDDTFTPMSRGAFWNAGFFGCGDMHQVKSLLGILPGIGRKASRGYGAIVEVDVDAIEKDLSLIRDGYPMRPIPEDLWLKMGGSPLPVAKLRARICLGNPDQYEVSCVAPPGERLSW